MARIIILDVQIAMQDTNPIAAIKVFKKGLDLNLKQAKDAVEDLFHSPAWKEWLTGDRLDPAHHEDKPDLWVTRRHHKLAVDADTAARFLLENALQNSPYVVRATESLVSLIKMNG
jgi:hypothetical protein